jgi:CheY-like chemotaxis protein
MAERPDMLFTDISMPEMDGLELTRRIRAHEAEAGLPPLPIVAMTAHAMDDHATQITAAGVDHVLTKPLKKADIIGKLTDLAPADVLPLLPG